MRTIWQFKGDEYFCIEDGSPATEEEIIAFKERHKSSKEDHNKRQLESEKEDKAWHDKYDPLIKEYFYPESDDEDDLEMYSFSSEDGLIYNLSTSIFDQIADSVYTNGKLVKSRVLQYIREEKDPRLVEMKKLFPEQFKRAVDGFLAGEHDT